MASKTQKKRATRKRANSPVPNPPQKRARVLRERNQADKSPSNHSESGSDKSDIFVPDDESQEPDAYVPDGPATPPASPSTRKRKAPPKQKANPKPKSMPKPSFSKAPVTIPDEAIPEDTAMDVDEPMLPLSLFEDIWQSAVYKCAYQIHQNK